MRYPPIIPGFPHILHGGDYNPDQWLDRPGIIDEDFRLMPLAGCNAFSVGIFSWTSYEPEEGRYDFTWLRNILDRMAADGHRVFLATPSGAKPSWMARKYPEIRRVVDKFGNRAPQELRHNHCLSSPVYREKVRLINTELARRFARHPAVGGWHISNELNGECFCPLCQERYREFLRRKYGTLEELNRAWYTRFWNVNLQDWAEVTPFVTGDAARLDWHRFIGEQFREWIAWEKAPLKEANPDLPVTTNFMGFFYGYDYCRVAPELDFICDDVYPDWDSFSDTFRLCADIALRADFQRALKGGRPALIMESCPSATNWSKYGRLKRPGYHRMQELLSLGHGNDGTLYFQWRKSRGNMEKTHGAVVDHAGHEHTRVFREVQALGALYRSLDDLTGLPTPADTAVIFDQDCRWALEFTAGPGRGEFKNYYDNMAVHHRALWERSISMDVIEARADFSRYRLLVAPLLYMFHPGTAARLKTFMENGGTLVLTYFSGYVDEHSQFFLGGLPGDGMKDLCGVWNEEIDGLTDFDHQSLTFRGRTYEVAHFAEILHPAADTETLATYNEDFYAGAAAVTRREVGRGRVFYLGAQMGKDFLDDFYAEVIAAAGVQPVIPWSDGVQAARRVGDSGEFLFLYNCDPRAEHAAELPAGDFTDVESGEIRRGRVTLAPFASWVLRKN